jgi:hypothetical protein
MLNKDLQGLRITDKMDSRNARHTVSRIGDARRTALLDVRAGLALIETFAVDRDQTAASVAVARAKAPRVPVDSDELARAIAEIEIASAALRESDPALEPWRPYADTHGEKRYLPVWFVIGTVWIVALLGLFGAIGAILYLAG